MADKDELDKNKAPEAPQGDKTDVNEDAETQMIPRARLKEEAEKRRAAEQKIKDYEAAEKARQLKEDTEKGNFAKIAADAKAEADAAKAELAEARRYNKFLVVATAAGIIDPELAYKALPGAEEGEDMETLVTKVVESKPYLVGEKGEGIPPIKSGGGAPRPDKPKKSLTEFIRNEMNR